MSDEQKSGMSGDVVTRVTPPALTTFSPPTPGATPPTAPSAQEPPPPAPKKRVRIFRWEGIIPFAIVVAMLVAGFRLFADRIITSTITEAATKVLGTEVDITGLHLDILAPSLTIAKLEIADPFDPMKNLIETGAIVVNLDRDPLLEKKIVINTLAVRNVTTGTRRARAATPVKGQSFAAETMRELNRFTAQFKVPLLKLVPLDTIKSLVLDPKQLGTVKSALALYSRADSVRDGVRSRFDSLRLKQTLDSAEVTVAKLRAASPANLGIEGTKALVEETRATLRSLDAARARVVNLRTGVETGVATLKAGVVDLDSARKADYAFARGLLKLPTFEGPDLGNALFGQPTIEKFQQAVYYAELAKKYVPPGLLPKPEPGPVRLRLAGSTIRFPKAREYPSFHVKRADFDFSMADAQGRVATYTLGAADITSEPALLGKPTLFAARRSAQGTGVASLRLYGVSDHRSRVPRDSMVAIADGVKLPKFPLPGLPLTLDLRTGQSGLTFLMAGDRVRGRWELNARQLSWIQDSSRATNKIQEFVSRALVGIPTFTLAADLDGTVAQPRIRVATNLDESIRDRVKAVFGEELRKAELKAREAVDRIVAEQEAKVRAKVAEVSDEANARVADAQVKLDEQQARLEEQRAKLEELVKQKTGGLLELPKSKLPSVRLPSIKRP